MFPTLVPCRMTFQVSVKLLSTTGELSVEVLECNSLSDAPFITTPTRRQVFKKNLDFLIASHAVSEAIRYRLSQSEKE
jgi:hypothetical protein